MIVPKAEVRQILKGELDEVVIVNQPVPPVGSVQAVQTRPGKMASCWVLIVDTWPLNAGGHSVLFKLAVEQEPPRFLSTGTGTNYVQDPAYGLRDGYQAEPECVPQGWQDEHSRLIREFEVAERLRVFAERQRERSKARRRRAA